MSLTFDIFKFVNMYVTFVSGSSETVLTDIEQLYYSSDLVLCNFSDIFHAQTTASHRRKLKM